MSELRNIESLGNKQGEFHPGIAPSEPGPEAKGVSTLSAISSFPKTQYSTYMNVSI